MNNENDYNQSPEIHKIIENIERIERFETSEMLACTRCRRTSPPTRVRCFYCNHELPVSNLHRQFFKPKLRRLEEHEKGFNLIAESISNEISDSLILKTANFLQAEPDSVRLNFESGKKLPLIRAEFLKDAEIIGENLSELGIKTTIISDEDLKLNILPRRLRALEFDGEKLFFILFNNDEIAEISIRQPLLIVSGAVFERRIDSREDLKKKKNRRNAETTETATDYLLLDIYLRNDFRGFRVESKGFDFSCLEDQKSLIVRDNISHLKEKFKIVCENVSFDEDYLKVRAALGGIWAATEKKDAGGIDRGTFSGVKRVNTISISNLQQFNRYSRLQKLIYEKEIQQLK